MPSSSNETFFEVVVKYGTEGSANKLKDILLTIGCPNVEVREVAK